MRLKMPMSGTALWQDLTENQAFDDEKKLLAWLDFWSAGNHDDRTISHC
jgi:uncharacterized protein (DUF1810 family)